MDVLATITKLREQRNWTEYQLSVNAQLPQSTISSWYRKDMLPSLTSLEKICKAFDISLAQFFSNDSEVAIAGSEQVELLKEWNKLNKKQRELLLKFLKTL